MPTFDRSTAECVVFTFKEGLLSAVAHDLQLEVTGAEIAVEDRSVEARIDPRSLRVVTALKDGRPAPAALSPKDVREIEARIVDDVLEARRYPEIRFVSTSIRRDADSATIEGNLTLHGSMKPVRLEARNLGGRWATEIELHQPDFGIKPFSALMGTLKIKPRVLVRVSIPVF